MEFDNDLNLIEEFPPHSYGQWKQAVTESLKGADFDKVMHTKTYEGITLKPIYRKEDIQDLPWLETPVDQVPYLRRNEPRRFLEESWLIAQPYDEPDLKKLNAQLLSDLNHGLTAITLRLKRDDRPRGLSLSGAEDLSALLAEVQLPAIQLFIQLDADALDLLPLLEQYCAVQGVELSSLKAGIGFDPTSEFARKGYLGLGLEEVWSNMARSVAWAEEKAPGIRILSLDGGVWETAGATSVQELGFLLSTAIGYIQGLEQQGFQIDRIAPLFQVQLSLGSNFFMEIAKIRAFRLLWADMIKAFGGNDASRKVWIHGKTASFNKSSLDIWVNLLRTTTEGFSGVIGGVDSLELECFNSLVAAGDQFASRLARNQQLILKEEAHFSRVIDPAGGCYYIESLTRELADKAWKQMQELESGGGMIHSLREGAIHRQLAETANLRMSAAHSRKDIYVGVNMYANPDEVLLPKLSEEAASAPVKAVELAAGALPQARAATGFEALRARISLFPRQAKVFLLNMGAPAEYKARSEFATGFFQVAGFGVISPPGFKDSRAAADAALASDADAFCVCGTDDNYVSLVPELCQLLKGKIMILAGYPQDKVESYRQEGIKLFIHLKADALAALGQLADLMEVTA